MRTQVNFKYSVCFLYFFFLFIHTFNYGGNKLNLYGFLVSITVILIGSIYKGSLNKVFIPLYTVTFVVIAFYISNSPHFVVSQLKYFLYLIPIVILPYFVSIQVFYNIFVKACLVVLAISILFFILNVGVDRGYGFPRMHGLLSEPSALSLPISIVLIHGLVIRSIKYILLGLVALFLSGSLMGGVILLFSIILMRILKASRIRRVILVTFFTLIIIALFHTIKYLALNDGGLIVSRLYDGLVYIVSFGENGYNPRFDSILSILKYSVEHNWLFGQGINAGEIYVQETGNLRDLNIWMEILLSFGLVGLFLFFSFLFKFLILNKNRFNNVEASLIAVITCYTFLNSAQGIVFQSLFFIIILVVKNSHGTIYYLRNNKLN